MKSVAPLVAPGGRLFLSIYNDQGRWSRSWKWIKRTYNRLPSALRFLVLVPSFVHLWGFMFLRDLLRLRPFESWRIYGGERGMDPWTDVVARVGGYPFEVAKPKAVFRFYRDRGFQLTELRTSGGGPAAGRAGSVRVL